MLGWNRDLWLILLYLTLATQQKARGQEPPARIDAAPPWSESCRRDYSCLWDGYRGTCRPWCCWLDRCCGHATRACGHATRACGRRGCRAEDDCCCCDSNDGDADDASMRGDRPRPSVAPTPTDHGAEPRRLSHPGPRLLAPPVDRESPDRDESAADEQNPREQAPQDPAPKDPAHGEGENEAEQPGVRALRNDARVLKHEAAKQDATKQDTSEVSDLSMPRKSRMSTRRSIARRPSLAK